MLTSLLSLCNGSSWTYTSLSNLLVFQRKPNGALARNDKLTDRKTEKCNRIWKVLTLLESTVWHHWSKDGALMTDDKWILNFRSKVLSVVFCQSVVSYAAKLTLRWPVTLFTRFKVYSHASKAVSTVCHLVQCISKLPRCMWLVQLCRYFHHINQSIHAAAANADAAPGSCFKLAAFLLFIVCYFSSLKYVQ